MVIPLALALIPCKAKSSAEKDPPIRRTDFPANSSACLEKNQNFEENAVKIYFKLTQLICPYLKSCEWNTLPGKDSIPGKLGMFGVLKWPDATMTWSNISTSFSTLALTSMTLTLNILHFSSNSTLLTAWSNVMESITLYFSHLAVNQKKNRFADIFLTIEHHWVYFT